MKDLRELQEVTQVFPHPYIQILFLLPALPLSTPAHLPLSFPPYRSPPQPTDRPPPQPTDRYQIPAAADAMLHSDVSNRGLLGTFAEVQPDHLKQAIYAQLNAPSSECHIPAVYTGCVLNKFSVI
jgi:hypothetical protein